MNVTVIIQARIGSSRLPGKVLKKLGDCTVLGHVITRCFAIPSVSQVVVATTNLEEDRLICQEALRYNAGVYRGDRDNVLDRYYKAACHFNAENIVRVTSDCPLIDPLISESLICDFLEKKYDYSRIDVNSFPRGLDTEVFTFETLKKAYEGANKDYEFEHVTPYIMENKDQFKIRVYDQAEDQSQYRLTLDTPQDWELISEIYDDLYKGEIFYWSSVLQLLQTKPDLVNINANIEQKKLGE